MLNIRARFHENQTFQFRQISTSVTNERTKQQTRPITIPPVIIIISMPLSHKVQPTFHATQYTVKTATFIIDTVQ